MRARDCPNPADSQWLVLVGAELMVELGVLRGGIRKGSPPYPRGGASQCNG